jgi:hypothetical protein
MPEPLCGDMLSRPPVAEVLVPVGAYASRCVVCRGAGAACLAVTYNSAARSPTPAAELAMLSECSTSWSPLEVTGVPTSSGWPTLPC